MPHIRIHTLCILCLLCMFPLSSLAGTDSPALRIAVEQGKAEAATLLQQGNSAQAYELYASLLRESPEDPAISLGLARAAMGASRPNQAVMAYEHLLERFPGEAALHKEMARAYMALGDRESAERILQLPASGAAEDALLLDKWEQRYARLQLHGAVRAGLVYDSNANQGPSSNRIDLGDWRVHLDNAKQRETFGAYVGAQLEAAWRTEQTGPWWLVGDMQGFMRGNENQTLRHNTARNWQWGRTALGLRHMDSRSLIDVRCKAEIFDYEWDTNVRALGPELLYVRSLLPHMQLIVRGGVDRRAYSRDSERDGTYGYAGGFLRFFFGESQHEFLAGARYIGGSAERGDYSYDGWEGSARFLFKLPYGFEFGPFVSFTQEFYHGPATVLETQKRQDDRLRAGVNLNYKINEAWRIETSYQYTNNQSKSNIYDYNQHVVSVGLAWTF